MDMNPKKAAELKIARAQHHINDVGRQIESYFAQRPLKLVRRQDPKSYKQSLVVKTSLPLPIEIALTIGDAAHNLRSALDILIYGILAPVVPQIEHKRIQFPFTKKRDSFIGAMASTKVNLASKEVVAEITRLEPYPGGYGADLFAVHALDLKDKHRLITPAIRTVVFKGDEIFKVWPDAPFDTSGGGAIRFNYQGDEIVRHPIKFSSRAVQRKWRATARKFEEETEFQPTFEISLSTEPEPFAGNSIIPALVRVAKATKDAVIAISLAANL